MIPHVGSLETQTILWDSPLWYSHRKQCWNTFFIIKLTHGSSIPSKPTQSPSGKCVYSDSPGDVSQRRVTCLFTSSPATSPPTASPRPKSCLKPPPSSVPYGRPLHSCTVRANKTKVRQSRKRLDFSTGYQSTKPSQEEMLVSHWSLQAKYRRLTALSSSKL